MEQRKELPRQRIVALDLARGGALVAMAVYHFCYDLELFGLLAPGTALSQPLRGLAVATAASFLALAGLSLVLAHGQRIRWRGYWRRLLMVAGAALLISVGSAYALPLYLQFSFGIPISDPYPNYIYFGILHCIAACSLIGLPLLRLPSLVLAALAALAFVLPSLVALSNPALMWTGLVSPVRPALDFVPILPWSAAFLVGMALGRLGQAQGWWSAWAGRPAGRVPALLSWPGQHSLAVYLIHQPVLIAVVWALAQVIR